MIASLGSWESSDAGERLNDIWPKKPCMIGRMNDVFPLSMNGFKRLRL